MPKSRDEMPTMQKQRTGYIDVVGGKVWYEIVGHRKNVPVVTIHGGPGFPHYYLEPLKDLSSDREVVFYDQLGCGNSEKPNDKSLWTLGRYALELKEVIRGLKMKQYHIIGLSWGTTVATAFALTSPKGLVSLTLSDSCLSAPLWEKDDEKLIGLLPEKAQKAIHEILWHL
jgi:proline iminopeptidase